MAYSSGVFSLAATNPVVTGTVISSTWANNTLSDIASNGLTNCLLKDGTQTVTANIPYAGFRITGIGAPSATGDALREGSAIGGTTPAAITVTQLNISTASPMLLTNGQLVTVVLTSQTVGGATLTIPDFANVSDEFTFKTKAQTLSNKTFVAPALGTPASGVVTNLTGTASININGTVGATTQAAGAFTTGTFSSTLGVGTTIAPAAKLEISGSGIGASNLRLTNTISGGKTFEINPYITGVSNAGFEIRNITTSISDLTISDAGILGVFNTTDATSSTAASVILAGGLAVAKKINVGTNAAIGGTLAVTGETTHSAPVTLAGYTVSGLPAGSIGKTAYVTDQLTIADNGAALTGGGTINRPVFHNGTAWVTN